MQYETLYSKYTTLYNVIHYKSNEKDMYGVISAKCTIHGYKTDEQPKQNNKPIIDTATRTIVT